MMVKTIRKIATTAGKYLDAEDRRVLGQGAIIALAFLFIAVTLAGAVGLAIRVFEFTAG